MTWKICELRIVIHDYDGEVIIRNTYSKFLFSWQNTRETAQAIKHMHLRRSVSYLENVMLKKEIVPFRRFTGGIGRAAQVRKYVTWKNRTVIDMNFLKFDHWYNFIEVWLNMMRLNASLLGDMKWIRNGLWPAQSRRQVPFQYHVKVLILIIISKTDEDRHWTVSPCVYLW